MSFDLGDVLAGLKTAYQGIGGMGPVLNHEPKAFEGFPTIYTLPGQTQWYQMGMGGTQRLPVYELTSTLVMLWQDNAAAAAEAAGYIDSVPAAVHADMTLGGKLDGGANCIVESCDEPEVIELASAPGGLKYLALVFHVRAGPVMGVA